MLHHVNPRQRVPLSNLSEPPWIDYKACFLALFLVLPRQPLLLSMQMRRSAKTKCCHLTCYVTLSIRRSRMHRGLRTDTVFNYQYYFTRSTVSGVDDSTIAAYEMRVSQLSLWITKSSRQSGKQRLVAFVRELYYIVSLGLSGSHLSTTS